MSAPALRRTARMRPVLLERLERQRGAHCVAALSLAALAVYLRLDSVQVTYSAPMVCVLVVGYLMVAASHEKQPAWDAALPMDPARYALARLTCGVAGAAFQLAVVVGLYAALFGDPEHPGWYPLALFAWGLTWYLVVATAFLRPAHPVIVLALLVGSGVIGAPFLLEFNMDRVEFRHAGVLDVLTWTALPLALAAAAAYAATRFAGRAPALTGWTSRREPTRPPAPAPSHSRRPDALRPRQIAQVTAAGWNPARALPLRRRGPHLRPTVRTVLRRHFALLLRFTIVPALTLPIGGLLVLSALLDVPVEAEAIRTVRHFADSEEVRYLCAWAALSWTVLVWLADHGAQRRWNDTLPVGTAKRRILHVTAGAAWLLLFVAVVMAVPVGAAAAAGPLSFPADAPMALWLGIPVKILTLYLAATFVLFCLGVAHHVFPLVAPYLFFSAVGIHILRSQVLAGTDTVGWGYAVSALWFVLYGAAAAGAIGLNEWLHRHDRLPTLREVRGFLRGWADTRPNPPLRGHAGH